MAHPLKPGDLEDAAEAPGSDLARHLHAFAHELDYVYRTLRRYGVRTADAEDVSQEVFLIAWRRRDDFDNSRPLRPWLGGIAFKLAHQYHQRRKPVVVEDIGEDFADADPTSPPELEPEALDARALVLRVLAKLPERYREVLVAHELDGTPVDEIASRWRVPRFTLYTRLRRARLAFAEEVNRIQAAAGKRPAVARSLAPGLLLTLKREEVPGAPPALQRHVMERLRAEAMLASRHLPTGGAGALLGLGWKWLAGLGAAALLAGVVLVATRAEPPAPARPQARAVATAIPSSTRSLPPPRLAPPSSATIHREPPPTVPTGLSRDLVGFWRFEDGRGSTRALDQTPGGQASGGRACELHELDPTQAWVPGAAGGGLELGLNGWLDCPQPALPRRTGTAFTVALWVKRGGSPTSHHFKSVQGIDNFTAGEAEAMTAKDPDYHRRDLFEAIRLGEAPEWRLEMQVMPFEEAADYRFNPFDVTKVWPHADYPPVTVGRLVLNRNPENHFAEVEQAAFEPANMVPGIGPSPDKMLLGRMFSYPDAHRYRIGTNYLQLPINRPRVPVRSYNKDGSMRYRSDGAAPVYAPNSYGGPVANPSYAEPGWAIEAGEIGRYAYEAHSADDDFVQAGTLWRDVLSELDRAHLVANVVGHLGRPELSSDVLLRAVDYWRKVDPGLGNAVVWGLGLEEPERNVA